MNDESNALDVLTHFLDRIWNHGDDEIIARVFVPDGTAQGLAGDNAVLTHDEYLAFVHMVRAALTDMTFTILGGLCQGDRAIVRARVQATTPEGRPVDFTGMCEVVVGDGKILYAHNAFDFLLMATQMCPDVPADALVRVFTQRSLGI